MPTIRCRQANACIRQEGAFAFFGGVPRKVIYDNLKTVVDAVFAGKERQFNRRFLALASHYLFEPVACTPASGWEKGQIENQAGNVREWLFTPTPRFADFAALNAWLATRCQELGAHRHPTQDATISEIFALEQSMLQPVSMPFDAYIELPLRVSSTCLVSVDRNRYSVPAEWVGKVVSVRISAHGICAVPARPRAGDRPRGYGGGSSGQPLSLIPAWGLADRLRCIDHPQQNAGILALHSGVAMGDKDVVGEPDQVVAVMGHVGDGGAGFGQAISRPVGWAATGQVHDRPRVLRNGGTCS